VAISQRNLPALLELLYNVSDPKSKHYGDYWTIGELKDLISPPRKNVESIINWIKTEGIRDYKLTTIQDFLQFEISIKDAEHLLDTTFRIYENQNVKLIRGLRYSVPADIASLIDFIGGVVRFPVIKRLVNHPVRANLGTNPDSIKKRYNITAVGKNPNNLQSINQFLGCYFSPSDLTTFEHDFKLLVQPIAKVIGPNKADDPGLEASLDTQYIMGVGQNISTWFYYTAGNDNNGQEPFIEWITAINNESTAPLVFSVSYGDVESSVSYSYATRTDVEFQKAGILGRSILFASGDSGVGCNGNAFVPNWPASSAFVTTVGGTYMDGDVETGVGFSGGGFSNYFSQPSYQSAAVAKFLSGSNLPPARYYNASGRGYPDISAFATNFVIVVDGGETSVDGTSCAAPTASGIISLLNDVRLNNGQTSLGFLNPFLYTTAATAPGAIFDITRGNNGQTTCPGFTATVGWDPVTGLGTLNYVVLATIV